MISLNLLEIERSIRALSVEEQLWLLESIARQIRENEYTKEQLADTKNPEAELEVIVSEPEIPIEIAALNDEFAISENPLICKSKNYEFDRFKKLNIQLL